MIDEHGWHQEGRAALQRAGGVIQAGSDKQQGMLRARTYGSLGPVVFVLHGGPAAVGEAAPIARELAHLFQVIEPFQRGSGPEPLTVARHVEDLDELVRKPVGPGKPSLVGESWGAMLALAYAAAHPDAAASLVLIGCGTFDKASRARMNETIKARTASKPPQGLEHQLQNNHDAADRILFRPQQRKKVYDYDPELFHQEMKQVEPFDMQAHTETWNDMLDQQEKGVYPAAFSAIKSPILMLHGAYDPHPGSMIYHSLKPFLPQIEYHELAQCGHSPWKERQARRAFFKILSEWLITHAGEAAHG